MIKNIYHRDISIYDVCVPIIPLCLVIFLPVPGLATQGENGDSLHWYNDWEAISAFGVVVLLTVIVGTIAAIQSREFANSIGFAALGGLIGLSAGLSLTPVVGAIIPAILTFMAGLTAYFFKTDAELRPAIGSFLISFAIVLMSGLYVGAYLRTDRILPSTDGASAQKPAPTPAVGQGPFPAGDAPRGVYVEIEPGKPEVNDLRVYSRVNQVFRGTIEAPSNLTFLGPEITVSWPIDEDNENENAVEVTACWVSTGWDRIGDTLEEESEVGLIVSRPSCMSQAEQVEELSGRYTISLSPDE